MMQCAGSDVSGFFAFFAYSMTARRASKVCDERGNKWAGLGRPSPRVVRVLWVGPGSIHLPSLNSSRLRRARYRTTHKAIEDLHLYCHTLLFHIKTH